MNNFDFLSVREKAASVVSFAIIIWSRHTVALSPTGKRGHCITRPNNGRRDNSSDTFYLCSEVFR